MNLNDFLTVLTRDFGRDVLRERGRVLGLLADHHPAAKREQRLLKVAFEAGIIDELLRDGSEHTQRRAVKKLVDEFVIDANAAAELVHDIATALGCPAVNTSKKASPQPATPKPAAGRQPFEPEMVLIKGGAFLMGSPKDELERLDNEQQHSVVVQDFEIATTLVTQAQWQAIMGNNPSQFKGDQLPVENVSWHDTHAFIERLNAKTAKNYRLPTEAEWEYAARAGTTTRYYTGNFILPNEANFDDSQKTGIYLKKTTPVGSYPPNPWGLYDMHGNVWEWTGSVYVKAYDGSEQRHASKNDTKAHRVLRGGAWYSEPGGLRSACRGWDTPGYRTDVIGFRLSRM